MPDGSRDCEIILDELRQIREMHIAHAATVRTEIEFIKSSLKKIETIESAIETMKMHDARQAGQLDGATWALAKVGAVAMALLGVVGWFVSGGWERLKDYIVK